MFCLSRGLCRLIRLAKVAPRSEACYSREIVPYNLLLPLYL